MLAMLLNSNQSNRRSAIQRYLYGVFSGYRQKRFAVLVVGCLVEASSTDIPQAEQPELTIFECKLPFISDGIHKLNLNGSNFLNFVCSSPVPK